MVSGSAFNVSIIEKLKVINSLSINEESANGKVVELVNERVEYST